MPRYLLLNLAFILVAATSFSLLRAQLNRRALILSALTMFVCMVVFNSYLTALPIVRYNTAYILGLHVGTTPVEDFSYLAVAVCLGPALFVHFSKQKDK